MGDFQHLEKNDPFRVLEDNGFFPYSGSDGDLFRKNGLGGYRVKVYPGLVSIQEANGYWRGQRQWKTIREYGDHDNAVKGDLTEEEKNQFKRDIEYFVKHENLPGEEAGKWF